jgi:hypothetical protein
MKKQNIRKLASFALAALLIATPTLGLAKNENKSNVKFQSNVTTNTSVGCLTAFGHLIAPGWIKMNGSTTINSNCKLPFGIAKKLGISGQPTPPATTTPDTTAPSVFFVKSNAGTSTVTISWFTNERTDSQIAYGSTSSYGSTTSLNSNLSFFHSVTITGLNPSTTYHFEIISRDASGNTGTLTDRTFRTKALPDTVAPVISNVSVSAIGSTTATVSWTTDESSNSKVYFNSGNSLDLATAAVIQNNTALTNHVVVISGLSASTTYSFAVRSVDASGNVSTSATNTFTTTS